MAEDFPREHADATTVTLTYWGGGQLCEEESAK